MFRLLFIVCMLTLTPLATESYAAQSQQTFPLSMGATKQNITRWLSQNKHTPQIQSQPQGVVTITSSQEETEWQITLTPQSPLATSVAILVTDESESTNSKDELLQYLEDKTSRKHEPVEQQQELPAPVLDKIGTVACLRAGDGPHAVQFSGVTIDDQGLILCTAHDLKEREEVSIVSTINTLFKGDIVKIDFARDLALIQIQSGREQVANIEEGRNLLSMGEKLYSIGCPVGLRGTINSGYINGPPRLADNQPLWQASMEIQPGSSGSPVFDSDGNFVAIVKGRHRVSEGIGFLIPLEVIIDFLGEQ